MIRNRRMRKATKPNKPKKMEPIGQILNEDRKRFLSAFEAPTQIYRFMHIVRSPLFLQRNLSYMKHRMSRSNRSRNGFHLKDMLERKLFIENGHKHALVITGVMDGQIWNPGTKARVDLIFAAVSSNGPVRKLGYNVVPVEVCSPVVQKSPLEMQLPSYSIAAPNPIPVPNHVLNSKSELILLLKVTIPRACLAIPSGNNGNGSKRRRLGSDGVNSDEYLVYTGRLNLSKPKEQGKLAKADLDIILERVKLNAEKAKKISIQEIQKTKISWENMVEEKDFVNDRKQEELGAPGKIARVCIALRPMTFNPNTLALKEHKPLIPTGSTPTEPATTTSTAEVKKSFRIVYTFHDASESNPSSELPIQIESRDDLCCLWCSLNCMSLYSLLKHLDLCHQRLLFKFSRLPKIANGAKIDVWINKSFEKDKVMPFMVGRSKRAGLEPVQSLVEFFGPDKIKEERPRSYLHDRLYYNFRTNLPIQRHEIDIVPDYDEADEEIFRKIQTLILDELIDINEGEKELFKLWNLFMSDNRHIYRGDCHIPQACKAFIELRGRELIDKNLYRNFCLHLANLADHFILSPQQVHENVLAIQDIMMNNEIQSAVKVIDTETDVNVDEIETTTTAHVVETETTVTATEMNDDKTETPANVNTTEVIVDIKPMPNAK